MIDGKVLVEKLLVYAEKFLYLKPLDVIYFRNLLLREFRLDSPFDGKVDSSEIESLTVPDVLVKDVEDYAVENGLTEESTKGLYSTYIFGLLSPNPSIVNEEFFRIKKRYGIEKACEYFYGLCVKNNYIQKTAIGKNIGWEYLDGKRTLEITINLSKPEKDNKEIAKLLSLPKTAVKYPACLLCKENEGFMGTATHPARENIRTVSLSFNGKPWFVQYSPYAYYNEHCIVINKEHVPMKITRETVENLFDFVDVFPNYMAGSNAALPIVGGSILNHEHYQGGGHVMPMQKAGILTSLRVKSTKKVKAGIVDWYNSVIRLESKDRKALADVAEKIITTWENFDCEACDILSHTKDVRHNTLSPIARKAGKTYILDMILRNNRTDKKYPDGIFHAHPEYHNIKKEGIGLIEAMGLFILPARLKRQLDEIADILSKKKPYDKDAIFTEGHDLYVHRDFIEKLISGGYSKTKEDAVSRVKNEVNEVCKNILYNTAVFKNDAAGSLGFVAFLKACGLEA